MSEATTPEQLRAKLPRVIISDEPHFVAEGDLLIPENKFSDYAKERLNRTASVTSVELKSGGKRARLVAMTDKNGQFIRWAPGVVLTYYIQKETFSEDEYPIVSETFLSATEDWMKTCGVEFRHVEALDVDVAARAETSTVFSVRKIDVNGEFIAAAFFPNDPSERRRVLIDPSFFLPVDQMRFNKTGVLRHELGHVLGFRHEHIRSEAPPDCPKEDLVSTAGLGPYDPQSVMHYFCGGVGNAELNISTFDIEFSRMVYGPPLGDFKLMHP